GALLADPAAAARPLWLRPPARPALGPREGLDRARREHALPLGARADQRHRHLELALDELHVAAGLGRERVQLGDLVERLRPARQRLEDRPAVVEVALMRREVRGLRAV